MQLTSSPRRALGLLAVSTIGMSTAVLGVTGTASAGTTVTTFSTATGATTVTVPDDAECVIDWVIDGAGGGEGDTAGTRETGAPGGRLTVTTEAVYGDEFELFPGGIGGDASGSVPGTGGTNAYQAHYAGTAGTDVPPPTSGGGGGGASVVYTDGGVFLSAFGGDGGFSDDLGNGGGGDAGAYTDHSGDPDAIEGLATGVAAGVISGTVTCVAGDPVAPGAPTLDDYVAVGDGTAKFWFSPGAFGRDSDDQEVDSSYEYQLNGGTWTAFAHGYTGGSTLTGTLTGLTNMTKYSLVVRATSAAGTSTASSPATFTPFRPTAAPAGVSASVGVTSVRISWTPPADAAGVVDYIAFAIPEGAQSDGELEVCETAGTSCTVAVKAGRAYSYGVASRDALRNEGGRVFGANPTAVVPASAISATLPKSNGALTSSDADGKVVAGTPVTVSGKDFLPGSTVELVVYSTPVKLGEAVVLADGSFSATVTLPKTLTDGVHHLVASGVDVNGNARNLVVEVTVSGGTAVLADTGFSAAPYLGAVALALLAGGGLIVASRRRTAA